MDRALKVDGCVLSDRKTTVEGVFTLLRAAGRSEVVAVEVEASYLQQKYSTEIYRVERGVRVDRVRVGPGAHDGAEVFVVGIESRGSHGARLECLL